ncbi:NB-ARC domain-containing protein [Streptomyces sp. NPDC002889]|uniref:NB-ARC domain-containing protein n=1 Tax=Streptomyces sp. NPDC002889 TaxID=3364669 RepID=UPI00368A62CC
MTAFDAVRDVAVMRRAEPLEESVTGWAPTDAVDLLTDVVVTGVASVDDPGHDYRFLYATGAWRGWTERDGVALGMLSSSSLVPGMSGAPVTRLSDGVVVGVVSARYNSADGWLRDWVWVARTEDLTHVLERRGNIGVRRRLVLDDEVSTRLSASASAAVHADGAARSTPAAPGLTGPGEAAREAAMVLTALDDSFQGAGRLEDIVELLISRVCGGAWGALEVKEFRRRLRLRGLDARVLVPRLAGHEQALFRWAEPLPHTHLEDGVSAHAARAFLGSFRKALAEELRGDMFAELSEACRRFLREGLEDTGTVPLSGFLHALTSYLPPARSTSVEAVLSTPRQPVAEDAGGAGDRLQASEPPAYATGPAPGRPELMAVAVQMCRLPGADPCTAGREDLVQRIASAVDQRMTRYGTATAFLCGQPGVGTSVVAVEAARALTPAFPGGVFYVDLNGLVPDASLNARTVVRIVAEALGVRLGSEVMDDARLFASFTAHLHDRRVLLILDNARDAAHVRPFVKAAAGCAVLVTSRDRAQDYADPGLVFEVGPLARAASVEVLTRCLEGHEPPGDEVAMLHQLGHLCGDVPLALRIIGARLAHPSGPTPSYLVQLLETESGRLDGLAYGDRAVRLAIRLSHDALDPATRRVFRLITAAPGAAVTGAELGHCLAAPALRQELLLNRLVDRSLARQEIVRMPVEGLLATFKLFDLVRLFAVERLDEEEPPATVRDFQHALVAYLCARLAEITDQVSGALLTGELDPTRFHTALQLAQDNDWLDLATQLALGLHVLYTARAELDAIIGINDTRIALHLRHGQPEEAVKACLLNAETLRSERTAGLAADAARQAILIAREFQLPDLVAQAEFKLSLILWNQEKWAEALSAGERAVTILTTTGRSAAAVPLAINNCRIARRTDDSDLALQLGRAALDLADRWGTPEYRAMALNERGLAEDNAGHWDTALGLFRRAADMWEQLGNLSNAANENNNAANTAERLEDPATAVHLRHTAAALWERNESFPRAMQALVDLSAQYATADSFHQASLVLDRAERMARGPGADAPPLLRTEVLVRQAAARLFDTDAEPLPVPAPFNGPSDADSQPEGTESATDTELERVRGVMARHHEGELGTVEAQHEVRSLLDSSTRNEAYEHEHWVYKEMGSEPAERPALEA